jgi:hypothetical protein
MFCYYGTMYGQNTATGTGALFSNTTGTHNTATGWASNYYNSSGSYNSSYGTFSMFNNQTGSYNSAYGSSAIYSSVFGNYNTAVGFKSLWSCSYGDENTAIGAEALVLVKNTNSWGYNTGVGIQALVTTTTGLANVGAGSAAGMSNELGNFNTYVGSWANSSGYNTNFINSTAIGAGAIVTGSDMIRLGNVSTAGIEAAIPWTTISDKRIKRNVKENVPGLAFIRLLTPVTYNLDIKPYYSIVQINRKRDSSGNINNPNKRQLDAEKEVESVLYTGFLAQDVEKAARSIGYDFSGVDPARNKNDVYGLRYSDFVAPLVKAEQELHFKSDSLKSKLIELNERINRAIKDLIILKEKSQQQYSQNYLIPKKKTSLQRASN